MLTYMYFTAPTRTWSTCAYVKYLCVHDEYMHVFLQRKGGHSMDEAHLHEILSEVDINKNGEVDMGEFLQVLTLSLTAAAAVRAL